MPDKDNEIKLKRVIGLNDAVLLIFGVIIGSGIFISPTGVLSELKSVSTTLIVWAVCGVISLIGAFCFAELANLVPKAGSGYAYLYEAFKDTNRFGDLPAFLSAWLSTLAITPGCITVIALTSSEYLCRAIFGRCYISQTVVNLIAALLIISCIVINCYSVKWSSRINNVFSVGKIAGLVLITGFGVYYLAIGKIDNLQPDFEKTSSNAVSWASAFYIGLYSYDGWYAINNVVEEVKNPKRNLPLAIFISLTLITVLYLLVNVSYLTLLSAEQMMSTPAVALKWADIAFGQYYSFIILIAVFIANYGSVLSIMLSNTRISFAAARDSNLPKILSMLDADHLTPTPSILLTGLISLLMLISSDIYGLIDFFSFFIWFFYGLNITALLVIKYKKKKQQKNVAEKIEDDEDDDSRFNFELPIIFPIIMIVFSFGLMIVSLFQPNWRHLIAVLFTLSGLVYYFPFVYLKLDFRFLNKLSEWMQIFFNVIAETTCETSEQTVELKSTVEI
jgi:amino acid transporter